MFNVDFILHVKYKSEMNFIDGTITDDCIENLKPESDIIEITKCIKY